MKKRILSLALTLGLVMTLCPTALAAGKGLSNFQKSAAYTAGTFTDVPASTWYTENVKTAYELGLMKGTSSVAFSPDGNITVGSAIALACRLHSIYETGGANFIQGNPWYQVYVDYALKNGIITQGQFTNYDAVATRRQFAAILAKALPEEALEEKNTVEDGTIPDLTAGSANYDDIYLLYRAGILTGSDSKGTFVPESTITRSSVAAIVSRMAMPQLRQSVTMKVVPATKLTMNQTSLTLEEGKTSALTVTPSPADATVTNVTWKSSNTSVATVDNGKVTAVKKGSATITATTANGVKATCKVTVTPAPVEVTGVSLNKSTMSLAEGTTGRLTATVKPSDATNDSVTWSSSNTSVATVSSGGTVTAKREGTATITVTTYNGKTATCKVTVTPEIKVSSVTVDPSSLTLEVGDSEYLSASVYPANATDDSVEWESSDTSVATVNSSGKVTAVAPGSARITATSENGRYDYCRVTVKASTKLDFSVPELNHNYGPMTIVYRSGGTVTNFLVNDFTFTSGKLQFGKARLEATAQGSVGSGSQYFYVRINLYDASGKLLDTDYSSKSVGNNQDFAVEMTFNVDPTALSQAASIEFVSYSGDKAVPGLVEPETPEPEPEVDPEKEEAMEIGKTMSDYFTNGMAALEVAKNEVTAAGNEAASNPLDPDVIMSAIIHFIPANVAMKDFRTTVSDIIAACGNNSYWSSVKKLATTLLDDVDSTITMYEQISQNGTDIDIIRGQNQFTYVLKQWNNILSTANSIIKNL